MTSQHIPAPITREAQVDPQVRRTAESIVKIINFLMFRVPDKDKKRFMGRIRGKIQRLPAGQVGLKQMPPTATIGQAVSLTKNILAGLNPFFVKQVIDEVGRVLERVRDVQQPTPVPLKPKGLAPFGPKRAFLDVVIQPLDPAVHRAVQQIKAKHPGLLKQVERIVVHPGGGGGHLGHVESGPDKNPREIHLFKGVIEQQLRKRMPGGRAAPKEWDDALEHAIVEVIGHEAGHIGLHERTPEQMRSQPFHGEGEAETRARETLQRVYPGRAAKKAHYSPMQSPWDYDIAAEQEDGLPWSGNMSEFLERFPGGLREWKAWRQSKLFKGHFDLKDGVQSNPSRPVKILPAPGFGKAAALRAPLSAMRCLGVLESLLGCPPHSEDFPAALAAWQEKAGGRPSGKLDRPTLARLRARIPEGRGLPRNFGIVSLDPLVCRGGMPDSRDELEALKKMGVERIVSLDDSIPDIAAWCGDLGLEHVDAPLAHGSPGDRGWEVLGPSIDGFLSEKPCYVHCLHGADRTGGVLGRFRTERGWPCDLAYKEAKSYGFKDIFVDLLDRLVDTCSCEAAHKHPPVPTKLIRDVLRSQLEKQEQNLLEPTPSDLQMNTENQGYSSGPGSLTGNPYGIRSIPVANEGGGR